MHRWFRWLGALALVGIALTVGCAGASTTPVPSPEANTPVAVAETPAPPTPTPTTSPTPVGRTAVAATATPQTASQPTPTPTPVPTPTPTQTPQPTPAPLPVTLNIMEGSQARYRVREQFADQNFPSDAVGETSEVSGAIVFAGYGSVKAEESVLVVDLRTLRSDDADRDDFLLGNSLESERYPFAEFVVREAPGLPWPLPEDGQATFQLLGDMTLHNNTSPLTWEVTAEFAPEQVEGTARTNFTFSTFHMVRPSRFFLLSVEDNIRLELDFIVSVNEGGTG